MGEEFLNGFLLQTTSCFVPEVQRSLELLDVVIAQSGRERRQ